MGATGFGYDVARQFGVPIREPRAGLVPLVLGGEEHASFSELTGVSAEVVASVGKRRFREKLLFTHRGLSGPAILQISSYWNGADPVLIDWAPGQEVFGRPACLERSAETSHAARAALRAKLPARLADRLLEVLAPPSWTNHAPRRAGAAPARLAVHACRHRRLRKGRSHRRRRRHRRAFRADHGMPRCAGSLLHR